MKAKLKYFSLLILLVLTIILSNVIFSKKEKVILDEVSLLNEGNKGTSFAMYYETQQDDGTYTYIESEDTTWPTDLRYNAKKSGCIDNNGNKIDGTLTYNKENNKVTLRTKSATLCYLYFDLGTEENPYRIQYIEDLVNLSNKVNKGEAYEEVYFTLERDLDFKQEESYRQYDRTDYGDINGVGGTTTLMDELTNPEGTGFTPIGVGSTDGVTNRFNGNFNGQDFTLSNLYVNVTDMHAGLFGLVGKAGSTNTIKNLTITGNITKNGTKSHAGGLAASSSASNLIIENVHNKANVTNNSNYTGGIIAYVNENVNLSNSSNEGNITTNGTIIGGIVGGSYGNATIENSTNENKITVDALGTGNIFVGGIIGCNLSISNLNDVHNKGKIKAENEPTGNQIYVGGIIGNNSAPITITNSSNEIATTGDEAGIIAINNSSNITYVGGIIGNNNLNNENAIVKIENSYNTSNIYGGNRLGGIVGTSNSSKLIINKCYNTGNLTGQEDSKYVSGVQAAGILGSVYSSNISYILNSYNTGTLTGKAINTGGQSGGFAVELNTSTNGVPTNSYIINSYNIGQLNASTFASTVSTLMSISNLTINNVYNLGSLDAPTKYGILRSTTTGTVDVKNAYYLSGVEGSNVTSNGSNLSIDTKSMSENDIKSQTFVDTLNSNINNIDLGSIDSELKDYKLEQWILGSGGYPTLNFNLENN